LKEETVVISQILAKIVKVYSREKSRRGHSQKLISAKVFYFFWEYKTFTTNALLLQTHCIDIE